jgi:hypothetical protein
MITGKKRCCVELSVPFFFHLYIELIIIIFSSDALGRYTIGKEQIDSVMTEFDIWGSSPRGFFVFTPSVAGRVLEFSVYPAPTLTNSVVEPNNSVVKHDTYYPRAL